MIHNDEVAWRISSDFIGSMLCIGLTQRFTQLLCVERHKSNSGCITNVYVMLRFAHGGPRAPYRFENLFGGVIFVRERVESE